MIGVRARCSRQAWLLLALLLTAGCARGFQNRSEHVFVRSRQIAGFPVFAQASEIDSSNDKKPLDAWTQSMPRPSTSKWPAGSLAAADTCFPKRTP